MSMVINHNLPAMNTYGKLTKNSNAANKSMEKLSSGLRINRAGDDAAGLAISEKMRGQIRGLDQANANAQDATNMLNTAEGALGTTEDILQRMKELATQAANDTNVKSDRGEIQKEINQLTSEINRIGNTTEFNTQKMLQGSGGKALDGINVKGQGNLKGGVDEELIQAQTTLKLDQADLAKVGDEVSIKIGDQILKVKFVTNTDPTDNKAVRKAQKVNDDGTYAEVRVSANLATGVAADENAAALRDAFAQMIDRNAVLKGNIEVTGTGQDITIKAVAGGAYDGGNASAVGLSSVHVFSIGNGAGGAGNLKGTSTGIRGSIKTSAKAAELSISIADTYATSASVLAGLGGKGMTIAGVAIEFYDGSKSAYTGSAKGIDISRAENTDDVLTEIIRQVQIDGVTLSKDAANANGLKFTADTKGTAGNKISIENGTKQQDFKATFQVGANKGQSMTIEIGDARAAALGVSGATGASTAEGAKFTSGKTVTNGTSTVTQEAALDVSSYENATAAIETIEKAIEQVSAERSKIGAYTNRLEYTIDQVSNTSENISNSESRIRDVDMAKEMMKYQTKNVNSQAAQAMLAQANQAPQNVLSLLR